MLCKATVCIDCVCVCPVSSAYHLWVLIVCVVYIDCVCSLYCVCQLCANLCDCHVCAKFVSLCYTLCLPAASVRVFVWCDRKCDCAESAVSVCWDCVAQCVVLMQPQLSEICFGGRGLHVCCCASCVFL